MNIAAIADTHTAIWYLDADERLSASAGAFMNAASVARRNIGLSSISLAEVVYLIDKGRLPLSAYHGLLEALRKPNHLLKEVFFTSAIVDVMRSIPRDQVPDMPDRIIAATALYLNVPIISRDRQISSALLETLW